MGTMSENNVGEQGPPRVDNSEDNVRTTGEEEEVESKEDSTRNLENYAYRDC